MKNKKLLYLGVVVYVILIYIIALIEKSAPNANIKSLTDAVWYTVVTLTTVGYGDFYPVTTVGKVLGLFIILGSMGILGYLIGEVTYRINIYMDKKKTGYFGTTFEDHFVIIGWNIFAHQVADQIYNAGHKIALVTNSKNDLELFNDLYESDHSFALFADYKNMEAYKKINITKSKAVFINFKEDTETLVFVLNIKKEFPRLNIVINCTNPELKATLENTGVNHVVARHEVASRMVASFLFEPHVAEFTADLISTGVDDYDQDIRQFKVGDTNPYVGQRYLDAFVNMKRELNIILIGLVVDGKLIKNPADDQLIAPDNYLIVISRGSDKARLEKIFAVREGF
ncbi:potassium channel family protein [Saccharicrinis fermentans]|uniref:Voltage-gated potassium channel n=1 Tax=Saccharicrinis fermentans DSM 9555 = JCM 21142 TaxID=869213 RepID=W7YFQ2_9BACT|nr:potassium channel protein [Saccharicrinis fermentans]GAF01429.1 voltage-gated potassium channel [Saccharicrinis fermentans DSM 9555 = JCM 21142]